MGHLSATTRATYGTAYTVTLLDWSGGRFQLIHRVEGFYHVAAGFTCWTPSVVIQVIEFLSFIAHGRQCFFVGDDFYIQGRVETGNVNYCCW